MEITCGIAKVSIIPKPIDKFGPLYIAGYATMAAPVFEGIHDEIYVRTLLITVNSEKYVFVSVDCVGLLLDQIDRIKYDLKSLGYNPANIFIIATHTHAAPDTMGMWGPYIGKSGINNRYMLFLKNKIIQAVQEAEENIEGVQLFHYQSQIPHLIENYRHNGTLNSDLRILQFRSDTKTKAIWWNYTAQPEITTRENRQISADYPGYVNRQIEQLYNTMAFFTLGLCGAQSPIFCEQGYEKMEEFGDQIFSSIQSTLAQSGALIEVNNVSIRQRIVDLPLENSEFEMLFTMDVFNREYIDGNIQSVVSKIRLGNLDLFMIPGEPFPGLLESILEQESDIPCITNSLVNDSVGYFIPKREYSLDPQEWINPENQEKFVGHETEALGYRAAEEIKAAVKDLGWHKTVLAIGPHADDLSVFAGGLICKLANEGNRVICVRITDDYDDCVGLPKQEAIERNRREVNKAYAALGAEHTIHLNYPSDSLTEVNYMELRGKLVHLIRKYKPDTVVGFDLNGTDEENMDHIIAARATNEACWQAAFDTLYTQDFEEGLDIHMVAERYLYARNPSVVNTYIDISSVIEQKIYAITQHKTVLENFFRQYRLSARANRLFIELLEAPIPNPIRVNLFVRAVFGEIGKEFGAKYGEVYNKIDAGLLKDFASD